MTILEDLKLHLINNGITETIYFNFVPAESSNFILLWNYDGTSKEIGKNARIQFCVKNSDMQVSESTANKIYDIVYPKEQFKKILKVNGKTMHIKPIQTPFYNGIDENSRHTYIFNTNVNYERK